MPRRAEIHAGHLDVNQSDPVPDSLPYRVRALGPKYSGALPVFRFNRTGNPRQEIERDVDHSVVFRPLDFLSELRGPTYIADDFPQKEP